MIRVLMAMVLSVSAASLSAAPADDVESIRIAQPRISPGVDGAYLVDAEVQVRLSPVLADAVQRGVPLYFVTELELSKSRWYWFDKKIITQAKAVRLMYHAVTQQYRVAIGGLHHGTYPTLEEALASATSINGWPVQAMADQPLASVFKEVAKNPDDYALRLRVRLDSAQLPKPLQVNALTNRDWNLSSDWVRPRVSQEASGNSP